MNKKLVGAAVGLVLAAGAASQAQAANVTLTGWAFGSGSTVQASGTSLATGYNGWAGAFTGSLTGAGALDSVNFMTWCIELEESFSFGSSAMTGYRVMDAADYFGDRKAQNPLRSDGAAVAQRLGQLITWMNTDPTRVDSAAEAVAMQLAIWNVVYDSDWNVSSAGAFRDGSAHQALASEMLQAAANIDSRYTIYALAKAGKQDFIAYSQTVPEPGSLALAGLAMLTLGATALQRGRRTSSRAAAASRTYSARL
jgi:PEP-CTERM motif